jgi:hypothetical protein
MYENHHTRSDDEFGINVPKACEAGMTPELFGGEERHMLVSHGPRPPENECLKNTCQISGGVSGRTIWASADSESKTAFTRFPESERCFAPVRQAASP